MSFLDFYRQKRGLDPFPWMHRLAAHFAELEFPEVIDLPTGSAKSDLVIVWAWARTQNAGVPRRLWMASDRRVIVDQTWRVAQQLGDDVLVSRLRGGIVADDEPVLDPVRPQVISSTVDQLGSRLLFRAYGSSPRSWPIWAALAGNDSLIVLDEAHLSPTAEDTFRACKRLGADIRVVSMTATPRNDGHVPFRLDGDDRDHPVLGQRLAAKRIVELRQGGSLARAAEELLASGLRRVAVVANTVRAARQAFEAVGHADKHLIIGRQRPLDRDRILENLLPRVQSGSATSEPLVVVATQCIEAGADFDFDGMVSEVCPIDALRQRLGRLDRLGHQGESLCILIAPEVFEDVPPYGRSARDTWDWLRKNAKKHRIDLGAEGWAAVADLVPDEARSATPEIVSFLEPHLRMLARTSPRPRVEPDIDLLLHGPGRASGAVSVVWRRDVDADDVEASNEILQLIPPMALEACQVPLWEFRAWLANEDVERDAGDIEGSVISRQRLDHSSGRSVLRWSGLEEGASRVPPQWLRAGDVVVLNSSLGGYDTFGWAPQSLAEVPDLADDAYLARTGRKVMRVDDPDANVSGDRVRRWSRGYVVETFTEAPRSRVVPREILLDAHSEAVAAKARDFASELALSADDLHRAGLLHDQGKAHPGWQLCVKDGDLQRLGTPPLAKGTFTRSPLSRLPLGWRHEAESLKQLPEDANDLVRWLVATHHGYARPFWPIADHGIGLAELMDQLQGARGYWGLALHEAVLRCADRIVSQEEMGSA